MRIPINSDREPMVIELTVKTAQKEPIAIRVADAFKPQCDYFREWFPVSGERTFDIALPATPRKMVLMVYNRRFGDQPAAVDKSFSLVSKSGDPGKINPLREYPEMYNSNSALIKEAYDFVKWFSENASGLSANGSVYRSKSGKFRIDYLDTITDRATGEELKTPARISQDRGIIEVSKKLFLSYTIPYRIAILLHEVSHFYLNDVPEDEEEADLNAVKIFLGKGFTCWDATRAFSNVFETVPSDMNVKRQTKILDFVEDFAKRKGKFIYK